MNIRRSRRWRRIPLPCSVWLSTIWRTTRQPLREAGRATRARERSSGRAEGGGRTQEPAALPRSTIVVRRDVCHSTARNLKLSDCKLIIVHFATFNLRPPRFWENKNRGKSKRVYFVGFIMIEMILVGPRMLRSEIIPRISLFCRMYKFIKRSVSHCSFALAALGHILLGDSWFYGPQIKQDHDVILIFEEETLQHHWNKSKPSVVQEKTFCVMIAPFIFNSNSKNPLCQSIQHSTF